ncbi:MAG: protein kinase [Sandaracinaceae bacterium]
MSEAAASERPIIEGYELVGDLGSGAAARVYEARDRRGATVAIKVLKDASDDVARARLSREAELFRALDHPALVRVHDSGVSDDGRPYLVMERVDGATLRELVEAEGPLGAKEAWALVREIAQALAHAHARGVLHRDLTSSNVLVGPRARPKLGDFGLARRATDPAISAAGTSVGTPRYMAPEQWWGAAIDERTDVYGLGAILYEALSGRAPWEDEDPAELVHKVATAAPRPPSARGAALAPEVEAFVMRSLARRPEERPRDVETFVADGDRAFGRPRTHPIDAWIALGVPWLLPLLAGYAGTLDPTRWFREAGHGGVLVLVAFVVCGLLAARWPPARTFAPSLPVLLGALGFVTGMANVERAVAATAPELRLGIFGLGAAEASTSYYLGATAAASILAMVALRIPRTERAARRDYIAALVPLVAGAFSLDIATLLVGALAATLLVRGAALRAESAGASLGAVLALGVAARVRSFSDAARVFVGDHDRAARAELLAEADRAATAVLAVTVVSLLAILLVGRWRGVRAWSRAKVALGAAGLAMSIASLVAPYAVTLERRADLRAELARHFALWNELDLPHADAPHPGRVGLTLSLGRRHVALDSEPVMLTRALETQSEATELVLAQAIGARLAPDAAAPELVVAADRSSSVATLRHALRAAYAVGVRQVDLLTSPGAPLRRSPSAPAEAQLVLPSDVRSMRIRLEEGTEVTEEARTVEELARRAPRTLRVGR